MGQEPSDKRASFCTNCGHPIAESVRSCSSCGATLSAEAPASPPSRVVRTHLLLSCKFWVWAGVILSCGGFFIAFVGLILVASLDSAGDTVDTGAGLLSLGLFSFLLGIVMLFVAAVISIVGKVKSK